MLNKRRWGFKMRRAIKKLTIVEDNVLMNLLGWIIVIMLSFCLALPILMATKATIRAITPPGYMDYDRVFKDEVTEYALAQGESDSLYLIDMKNKKVTNLELNYDLVATNSEYNKFYLIDFLEAKIEVKEIKKFKDIIINSDEFEIKTVINKSNDLEVKVENNFLFVFDKTENQIIQLDLKSKTEEKRLETPSDVIEWAVSDDKVYAATTNTIYTHNANNELETFLEWEDMRGISINDGILTILDFSEEFGSLTSFNLDTLEFCAGTAFEAKEVGLIEASSSEPYVYFHTLNFQGGLTINVVNLKTDNEYLVDLNLNDVKGNLKFYKGYGYYINKLNDSVVFTSNGELLEFDLEEPVKNIYPFY